MNLKESITTKGTCIVINGSTRCQITPLFFPQEIRDEVKGIPIKLITSRTLRDFDPRNNGEQF